VSSRCTADRRRPRPAIGPPARPADGIASTDRAARRKATGEQFSREIEDDAAFEDAVVEAAETAGAADPAESADPADQHADRTGRAQAPNA